MVQKVDPFIHPIPNKFINDSELRPYFEFLHRWAHDMWMRTGGSQDEVSDTGLRETYPWIQESKVETDVSRLYSSDEKGRSIDLVMQAPEFKEIITKTISNETYTAVDNMFVNMTNNSTLVMPLSPERNSVIYITKDDTIATLRPNGKKVNGVLDDIVFYKERLARQIHYFIDADEWFFI